MKNSKTDADVDFANFDFEKELAKLGVSPTTTGLSSNIPVAPPVKSAPPVKAKPGSLEMPGATATKSANPFWILLTVTILSIVLWFVPYAEYAIYPFRLFVTFMHEMGHALATMATGGQVQSLSVAWDTSGLTYSLGGWMTIIASAGYVGTMLFGCLMLLVAKSARLIKPSLAFLALLIFGFTLFYGGTLTTWVVGLVLTGAFLGVVGLTKQRTAHYFLSFLSVQCILNAIYDLKNLFILPTEVKTDAVILSEMFWGVIPPTGWAVLWSASASIMLFFVLRSYYKLFRNQTAIAKN